MIKIITHHRLKPIANGYTKTKSNYKVISKQIYFFENFLNVSNKVNVKSPFSDVDLYCYSKSKVYKELQKIFISDEEVLFFGYNNNFSKYLFWQYINEFDLNRYKIILTERTEGMYNVYSVFNAKEYILDSKDIRKAIAIYYLNNRIKQVFDKEFKVVNLYEAYLYKKNESNDVVKNKESVKIENHILYEKIPSIYSGFDIKNKTFSIGGFYFIINTFYEFAWVKFDSALYLLRYMNVIKEIEKNFHKEVYKFKSLKDISKIKFEEFKNILIENYLVEIGKALKVNTGEFIDSYRITDPGLNSVKKYTKTKTFDEIAKKYYQFLMSMSCLLFYVFEEDLFSNFISTNSHYAIATDKLKETISEIKKHFPIKMNMIDKEKADSLKEKMLKADEFKNFNELAIYENKGKTVIRKTLYDIHKLKYLESINPVAVSQVKLVQLDRSIDEFSSGIMTFQEFLSSIEFIRK